MFLHFLSNNCGTFVHCEFARWLGGFGVGHASSDKSILDTLIGGVEDGSLLNYIDSTHVKTARSVVASGLRMLGFTDSAEIIANCVLAFLLVAVVVGYVAQAKDGKPVEAQNKNADAAQATNNQK